MPKKISELGIQEIMSLLPHRSPMLMIDRMKDIVPGKSGIGIKNLTVNEPFFQGHFPTEPIMPGVLQVEAMAQTAGIVVLTSYPKKEQKNVKTYFMTIDSAKFRKKVVPGDVLELRVQKERQVRNVYQFSGKGYVADQLVVEARFSAMIVKEEKK